MHRRLYGPRHMYMLRLASTLLLLLIVFLASIISVVAAFGLHALLTLSPSGERHVHVTQAFTHRGHRRNKLDDAVGRKEGRREGMNAVFPRQFCYIVYFCVKNRWLSQDWTSKYGFSTK